MDFFCAPIFYPFLLFFFGSQGGASFIELRNLANALRNLGRRTEAVQLVWQHITVATGDEVEKTEIDCSKWEAPTNKDAEVVVVSGTFRCCSIAIFVFNLFFLLN